MRNPMEEEAERELIRRLSEKSNGGEAPPQDLLAKIVGEIPDPLPIAKTESQKGWALPRTQWLRLAAMLILFVGAGFLATRIIPDLSPKNAEHSETAAKSDRSTVTEPAAPGAGPAAAPARPLLQAEKPKAAPSTVRDQPLKSEVDSASREGNRRPVAESVVVPVPESRNEVETRLESDRLEGDAKRTDPRPAVQSRDEASPVAPRPAEKAKVQSQLRKEEKSASGSEAGDARALPAGEAVPMRAPQAPPPQAVLKDDASRVRNDEPREKKALATSGNAAGALSAAARSNAAPVVASESITGFTDAVRQPRLVTPLVRGVTSDVTRVRRARGGGSMDVDVEGRAISVDDSIALPRSTMSASPGQTKASAAIHVEGAASPGGRDSRFFLVLFELQGTVATEPAEARAEFDAALVSRQRLIGRSVPSAPLEPIRLLYELELRRAPEGAARILSLDILSRSGGVTRIDVSGRQVGRRWDEASAHFRIVSLAALVAERKLGLPAAREMDGALLDRRLQELARAHPRDADVKRLIRVTGEQPAEPAARTFAPEPALKPESPE